MKLKKSSLFLPLILSALATANAAPITRSATADSLNIGTAWVSGLPNTADVATWDASSTLTNTMGANNTWGGLDTSAAAGALSITGANNLLLDNTVDANTVFNTGANNFTWGAAATAGAFNINGAAGSTSSIATGATFSGSGTVTISSTGTKNWSTNGTTNGVTNVSFTGTLALRGATIPAVGTLSGNWLALGGGGGAAADVGTTAQTGSFALDTGDATTCGGLILTQGFSGQSLKLNSLQGTGSIRADWGVGIGIQNRGIELNQVGNTTLSGSILASSGSGASAGARRNINFTKKGAGTLTLTGGLGTSSSVVASLSFDVQGGAIQLGDGTTNPIYVNAASWDAASTFNIASGAKLRFMANASTYTWTHAITSGSGTIEITNDGTPGEGNVEFSANNSAFTGNVDLNSGSLRIGPNLGTGTLTVNTGTYISSGLAATKGTSQVGNLVLEPTTESNFRLGATHDQINVTGSLTPPASDFHTINLDGANTSGGTVTLIDYTGTALTGPEFARFVLGALPSGTADFQLVNNTANTSIDLIVTLEDQVWKATSNGNWDYSETNWALASTPGSPEAFSANNPSLFNDSAAIFNVIVDASGVGPLLTTFDNSLNNYTLTGGGIDGSGGLRKKGSFKVTLDQPNSYSGDTTVENGILSIGSGGATGDIGSGAVVVGTGATLEFNRSNAVPGTPDLDYKTTAKMRNVSGAGNITLTGGVMLFNYPGGGLTFNSGNTWAGFSGNLTVKGGSEFMTIRNGATAMGTGSVILGDGSSSGSLSQIEGNWTWTNPIQLVGAANKIINRAVNAPRTLKLQGVISSSGGLTFEDATGGMNDANKGFILTGANTMNGTLTIAAGTPVRVGGVPGAVSIDAPGSNAAASGNLGDSTVVNNGILTFSRTDAFTVANAISGPGAIRIGIPAEATLGDTTTQIVTFTGTKSYTGDTNVNNGTLVVGTSIATSTLTTVAATGTLAGSGTVGPVTAAGAISPGTSGIGTLAVGNTTLTGTYACDVTGATSDLLTTGTLDITGATLALTGTPIAASYTIATYTGPLAGTFTFTPPLGYALDYTTPGQIKLVTAGSDYTTWIGSFTFAPGADKTATGDPDGDGLSNQQEYAFGLDPSSGSSVNPITVQLDKTAGTLTYTRRKPSLTGLTNYQIWTSPDLAVWTVDAGATASQVPTNVGDNQSVAVTLTGAPLTAPKLFVRVTAE